MPKLKEINSDTLVASVGGGALFSKENGRFSELSLTELSAFFYAQSEADHTIIAVIGGGPPARDAIAAAREKGINSADTLDRIGIRVTWKNAEIIKRLLTECGLPVEFHRFDKPLQKGVIYVRGGNRPGHTTDFVAVQAAHEAGQDTLLNITSVPGVFPVINGEIMDNKIIEFITWDKFLETVSVREHNPGINTVFDRQAALLAKSYNMTVVVIGGQIPRETFQNVTKFLKGEKFTGTVIRP